MCHFDFYRLFKCVQKKTVAILAMSTVLLIIDSPALGAPPSTASAQNPSQLTPAQILQYVQEQKVKAAAVDGNTLSSATAAKTSSSILLEPSGRPWCVRFAPSARIDDLKEPFKGNLKRFYAAIVQAGIRIVITTTYRPEERSYLMHYSTQIARNKEPAAAVPSWQGVNIDWMHRDRNGSKADLVKAKSAARDMMFGYGIGSVPVSKPGRSLHNSSQAIDMLLSNFVGKTILDAQDKPRKIKSFIDLKSVGASYGVIWYGPEDRVHWSLDGN